MPSVNKVILVGHVGREPDVRYKADGTAITTVSLATTERWKDKVSGQTKEATEWHRVVFFNRIGEIAAKYIKKGNAIYTEGRLRTRKWADKDGSDRYVTEVVADEVQFLSKQEQEAQSNAPQQTSFADDDIAF